MIFDEDGYQDLDCEDYNEYDEAEEEYWRSCAKCSKSVNLNGDEGHYCDECMNIPHVFCDDCDCLCEEEQEEAEQE